MSLIDVVRDGIETAFTVASDFVVEGTYTYRGSASVYDPVTDTQTAGEVNVPNVRMMRTTLSMEEREASVITVTDVKVLIPAADLPGITPRETDTFVMAGIPYNVLVSKPVPGNVLWIVYAREK